MKYLIILLIGLVGCTDQKIEPDIFVAAPMVIEAESFKRTMSQQAFETLRSDIINSADWELTDRIIEHPDEPGLMYRGENVGITAGIWCSLDDCNASIRLFEGFTGFDIPLSEEQSKIMQDAIWTRTNKILEVNDVRTLADVDRLENILLTAIK